MNPDEFVKKHGHIPALYYSQSGEYVYSNDYTYGPHSIKFTFALTVTSLLKELDEKLNEAKGGKS